MHRYFILHFKYLKMSIVIETYENDSLSNEISEAVAQDSTVSEQTTETTVTPKRIRRMALFTHNPIDLVSSGRVIGKSFKASPYRLSWFTADEMLAKVEELDAAVDATQQSKNVRTPLSFDLSTFKKQSDKGAGKIKHLIRYKFDSKDEAETRFREFGFDYDNGKYFLPMDMDKRIKALGEMRAAIIKYGFSQEEYGEAFWTNLIDGFAAAAHNARLQDSTTSGATGDVKKLADEVWLMHKAISSLLDAEAPLDSDRLKRSFGFHREKN